MSEPAEDVDLLPPEVPQLRRLRRKQETITYLQSFLEWAREHPEESGLAGPPETWDVERAVMGYLRIDLEQVQEDEQALAAYLKRLEEYLERRRGEGPIEISTPQSGA